MKPIEILVLGSSGMLGQALMKHLTMLKRPVCGVARKNADICLDVCNDEQLLNTLKRIQPKIIINTVAIVDLAYCQQNPLESYHCNARVSSLLSRYCQTHKIKYVYISTDHYYANDNKQKHREDSSVCLANAYASSKYFGEFYSLKNKNALVVRTNIVGFRHKQNSPTFVEWVIHSLQTKQTISAFDNVFTSSIDVCSFSNYLIQLIDQNISGTINLASSQVFSKYQFIMTLAKQLKLPTQSIQHGLLETQQPTFLRNESLGLDVSKAQNLLHCTLPTLAQVINNLAREFEK